MGHITGKINLAMLEHVIQMKKGKTGEVECLVIPIKINNLYRSDKGNVFLDLICFDSPKPEFKQTHAIKQSLSKEVRDKMSEEEQKNMPFLGSLDTNFGGGGAEPKDANKGITMQNEDDVPF